MSEATTLLERIGTVVRLIFNRPRVLNAINYAMLEEMDAHIQRVLREKEVRALVVCGSGSNLSSGADIKEWSVRMTSLLILLKEG